jgi:SnoaL-like domain
LLSWSFIVSNINSSLASVALDLTETSITRNAQPVSNLPPVGELEAAKVVCLVTSIPLAVDLAAYDLAEKAFAPKVVIDFTSLWGGNLATMTPAELMTTWRDLVPGFDATWHELSKVEVCVAGHKATAAAYVDARFWLDGQVWRPIGNYNWDLEKLGGQWKVTRMQFAMTQEIGSRDVATKAMEVAKAKSATQVAAK